MGSWNEHCAMSAAPIRYQDRVVGIPITTYPDMTLEGYRDTTMTHFPVAPPIRGSYDMYGGIVIDGGEDLLLKGLLELNDEIILAARNQDHKLPEIGNTLRGSGSQVIYKTLGTGLNTFAYPLPDRVLYQDLFHEGFEPERVTPVIWCMIREEVFDFLITRDYDNIPGRDSIDAHFEALPLPLSTLDDDLDTVLILQARFWCHVPHSERTVSYDVPKNWLRYFSKPVTDLFRERMVDLTYLNSVMYELGLTFTPAKTGRQEIQYSRAKEYYRFLHRLMVQDEKK